MSPPPPPNTHTHNYDYNVLLAASSPSLGSRQTEDGGNLKSGLTIHEGRAGGGREVECIPMMRSRLMVELVPGFLLRS